MKGEIPTFLLMGIVMAWALQFVGSLNENREMELEVTRSRVVWEVLPVPPKPELSYIFPIHEDDFIWDGDSGDLTSPFGERDPGDIGGLGDEFHDGLDLWGVSHVSAWQARVVAIDGGRILNHWVNHPVYGRMIEIEHGTWDANDNFIPDGRVSMYAHLSKSRIHEKRVDPVTEVRGPWRVKQNDVLGRIGNTSDIYKGMKTHLHFQLTIDGELVNPLKYIRIP